MKGHFFKVLSMQLQNFRKQIQLLKCKYPEILNHISKLRVLRVGLIYILYAACLSKQ
jgi:hypothetical protein